MEGLNNFKTGEVPILWGGEGYIFWSHRKRICYIRAGFVLSAITILPRFAITIQDSNNTPRYDLNLQLACYNPKNNEIDINRNLFQNDFLINLMNLINILILCILHVAISCNRFVMGYSRSFDVCYS